VPSPSGLRNDPIAVVFASGSAHLNRELIDRVANSHPELPLAVVGEFEPHKGEWIPYHVFRQFKENLATVKAAIGTRPIAFAAMIFDPAARMGQMRLIATVLARRVTAYDDHLVSVSRTKYLMHRVIEAFTSRRAQKWLKRLRRPSEAEVPVRARAAQLYGIAASRIRKDRAETPIQGAHPLAPGVTVVIPSRDGRDLLATLLPGLIPQLNSPQLKGGEIIVSDNGSDNATSDWLTAKFPSVRVIRNVSPLSFSRAVNAGIVAARFSHVLLLNNDMVVQPGFVQALVNAFEEVPDLFCATAQIFFPPGARREETGKAVWRRESPLDFPVRCDLPVPGENLTWVLYGSGGCSLFDTEKLRELGGVSEVYDPAYVEDLDFGYRAWKRGWPSVFVASAQVEHRHRATTSRYYTPEQLDTFVEENYLRFLIHAVGSPALFRSLWTEAIRRLQLKANIGEASALEVLRRIPRIGSRPAEGRGPLLESEILALGSGDIAIFPGKCTNAGKAIVVASPYLPFPLSHGGAVRIYNLMRHTAAERDQVLIAFTDELAPPPAELVSICREVILVRRHGTHYRLDTPRPDVVEEFASEAFRACLKQTIHQWRPEIAQLEFTQMAQYAKDCAPARTVLIEHDITFDLQQQLLASTTETGAPLLELQKQLAKWKAFETASWTHVDCVVTMSPKDEAIVTGSKRVVCLPNGVDTARFQPSGGEPESQRLLFIGSFAHLPNLLALAYFLREIWPLLGGGFRLHVIAGARHDYFLDFYRARVNPDLSASGIELEDFVSDVREAYRRAELVLAPLTASAGTNIKVLEAMAMGRVVVSTPAGANGLDVTPGHDVIVASTPREFADQLLKLSSNPDLRRSIERNARLTALRYRWSEIGRAQMKLYGELTADDHFT
jgi:GT2 family glycosyltransferase/glycosyltransferase involved in cell wall biosynthesis